LLHTHDTTEQGGAGSGGCAERGARREMGKSQNVPVARPIQLRTTGSCSRGGFRRFFPVHHDLPGTGLFRALRADHTLFPGSLTRRLFKKKIPEMILEVPGTKERELGEK